MANPPKSPSKGSGMFRNLCLILLVVSIVGGLFAADQYIRNRPAIQATRFLEQNGVPLTPESAVEASRSTRLFILEQLELARVDLGLTDEEGQTPLLAAVNKGASDSIDFLLERDAVLMTIDQPEADGHRTALAIALGRRDFGLAKRLVNLGADPNVYLGDNRPLVEEAARTEDDETLTFLLKEGADPSVVGIEGFPPIVWAIEAQDGYRTQQLLEAEAEVDVNGTTGDPLLIEAIQHGEIDLVDTLLAAGADPERVGASGTTPLSVALSSDDLRMVEVILTSGVDLQQPDRNGVLPVDFARAKGDAALLKMILDNGALLEQSAFEDAVAARDVTTASLLIDYGGAAEAAPEKIGELLGSSLQTGALELSRTMIELGGSAKGRLWDAIETRRADVIKFALENGAHVAETADDGREPLDYALSMGHWDLAFQLLERGADPNLSNADGELWVASAIRSGEMEGAEMLIEYGAELQDVMCNDGHSLLEWALARKASAVVKGLLEAGADPNRRVQSPAGRDFRAQFKGKTFNWHLTADSRITPLMLAAERNDVDSAIALMAAGAATGNHSRRYLWPINIAAWNANVPMQRVILKRDPYNYEKKFVIDLSQQSGKLYENGRVTFTTRVSTGKRGYRTPSGTYVITDKHRHHTSSLYDSSMPYFQRFSCSAFGIHEGYVPRYAASHGCIRLPRSSARHMFYSVTVGDVMVIQP